MNIQEIYQRIRKIDRELKSEYADGETCWAANLEAEKEKLENAICIMEKIGLKRIESVTLSDIQWDADESADLPNQVVIIISPENMFLLEDLDQDAGGLADYLSDEYGYCHFGFRIHVNQ